MKATEAWICLSCEEIFNGRQNGFSCPRCARGPTYPIATWLKKQLGSIRNAEAYINEQARRLAKTSDTIREALK